MQRASAARGNREDRNAARVPRRGRVRSRVVGQGRAGSQPDWTQLSVSCTEGQDDMCAVRSNVRSDGDRRAGSIRGQGDQGWVGGPSRKFLDAKMKWPKTEEFFDFELSTRLNHGISRPSTVCRGAPPAGCPA